MIFKDIVTKRTYTTKGEEKTQWLNVGTYKKTDDGKEFIELNMYPNTPFYLFEKKDKTEKIVDNETGETIPQEVFSKPSTGRTSPTEEHPEGLPLDDIGF